MADIVQQLPDAPWRHLAGLSELCHLLGAERDECRFVGGIVRDTLLQTDAVDIDLATVHAPEEVMNRLKAGGIRVVPTGLAHGTVTAVLADGPIEVTTLRRDVETDGRHAQVAFTDDWKEDAARRDFTINALYAEPITGKVHDYFGGLADLKARHVRFIGNPYQRIEEDHLRILRFFRFLARFGDAPDGAALAACVDRANDLMALSRERIAAEVLKLLVAQRAVDTAQLMAAHGIFKPVLPEITASGVQGLARTVQRELAAQLSPDAIRRLASILPVDPAIGDAVAARLKLSNAQRKRIASALMPPEGTPQTLAYQIGKESAMDRLLLHSPNDDAALAAIRSIQAFDIPNFPLGGGRLVEMGVTRGPEVARLLQRIERQWIGEGFPGPDRIDELATQAVDQWARDSSSA